MKGNLRVSLGLLLALLGACNGTSREDLPPALGHAGEVYLVMDSTQWKGLPGKALDSLFSGEMPGLPRPEPRFRLRRIAPRKLNFLLKRQRNLIFAFTLDRSAQGEGRTIKNLLTPASLNAIKSDANRYATTVSDVYARGQEVMYLYAETEEKLVQNLRNKGAYLLDYFDRAEEKRLRRSLFAAKEVKGVSQWLKKNFQCDIRIPFGYKLVERHDDFLWVRQMNPTDDKIVWVARTEYTSEDQLERRQLIAWRDRVCKKYLFEDPDVPDSYLLTETTVPFLPVTAQTTRLNGQYAVKMRGLWRANNFSMGGPFVAYAVLDAPAGKIYYVEGFTFSPSKDQREIIRELETILTTFRIVDAAHPVEAESGR